ncbi:lysophospholipid acyltransferase family protein [Thermosynechococcaceae cyanobacterium BACA0444]|uniref:Lysophospholipid acyltransferase family protein n=1 Tax=Pseudocalidococcus azoricus BACA0444 TaxID=2918990 RepID=A0AAE4FUX4_9CYAN|nr:lysophospholipid acyltransferase family protein [Pseudocalidococcus azoricus]MDS3862328.1 lysophospholipid acyltransferase family protein [Pseudocalidococcus azoricus BACA0444]
MTPKVSPGFARFLYWAVGDGLLRNYFRQIEVTGQDYVPLTGPVIIAPTHRSRWDGLLIPYVMGRPATGRDLFFMVSHNEMLGLQGLIIRHFGGFPVNTTRPGVVSFRTAVDLLRHGQALVLFPEGNIFRNQKLTEIRPGLARIALQAATIRPKPDVKILPVAIQYAPAIPQWRASVTIRIGQPLSVATYPWQNSKQAATALTQDLTQALVDLESPEKALCSTAPTV